MAEKEKCGKAYAWSRLDWVWSVHTWFADMLFHWKLLTIKIPCLQYHIYMFISILKWTTKWQIGCGPILLFTICPHTLLGLMYANYFEANAAIFPTKPVWQICLHWTFHNWGPMDLQSECGGLVRFVSLQLLYVSPSRLLCSPFFHLAIIELNSLSTYPSPSLGYSGMSMDLSLLFIPCMLSSFNSVGFYFFFFPFFFVVYPTLNCVTRHLTCV